MMAFSYTVDGSSVVGSQRNTWGTFTNTGGGTGGAITTGLLAINSAIANNETTVDKGVKVAVSGGTMTVTINSNDDGTWSAIGYGGG
tara:strand:- start:1599 stop:1859 length:261 start_codon:yes stop_codon:yes gene_type:complete